MSEITNMIYEIITAEGGYADHPNDRGGPTKWGVTLKTLQVYRSKKPTKEDVKALTKFDAFSIYYFLYYAKPKINTLPLPIQKKVLDIAINSGPANAVKLLQRTLAQKGYLKPEQIDGIIGPRTEAAAFRACDQDPDGLLNALVDARIAFYNAIVARDPSQAAFRKGWLARAEEFRPKIKNT